MDNIDSSINNQTPNVSYFQPEILPNTQETESKRKKFKDKLKIVGFLSILFICIVGAIKIYPLLLAKTKPQLVTLTYWGLWESKNAIQPLIDEYQRGHQNITINYLEQSPQLYQERLSANLQKENGPDIFRFHNTWRPMVKNYLSFIPPGIYTEEEYEKIFYPITKADLKSGQKYYGIPLEIDTLQLFYNEDIFKKANLYPPMISTWEDFRTAAKTLTIKDPSGKVLRAGAAVGTTNNIDYWSDILGLMFLQNGTDMKKISNTILADSSNAGEDVINYYIGLAKGEDKIWDDTLNNSTIAFAGEKVAMYFGPSWATFEIKKLNPILNFKVIPVPQNPNQQTNWATYWVEGVNNKSKYEKESWEFLKFLSSKESLQKLFESESKERLFGKPFPRVDMNDLAQNNENTKTVITQAPSARSWYLCDKTMEGEKGINFKMREILRQEMNQLTTGKTSKEILTEADKKINQVLSTYGLAMPVPTSSSR